MKKQTKANGQAKAKGPACECGCGGTTKGGRFLVGHDAKLKGRLIHDALGHRTEAGRKAAEAQIAKLGWSSFLTKSRKSRDAKAAKAATS